MNESETVNYITNDCMLTTIDNPYDPFEQFDDWLMFDKEHHHNTCELVARNARISDDMTQKEEDAEMERAMNEIIKCDELVGINKYIKVFRKDK